MRVNLVYLATWLYFGAETCVTKLSDVQNLEDNYVPLLIHPLIWEVHIRSVPLGSHKALTPQASLSNHGNFPLWPWQSQDVNISFCCEGLFRLRQEDGGFPQGTWFAAIQVWHLPVMEGLWFMGFPLSFLWHNLRSTNRTVRTPGWCGWGKTDQSF